MTMPIRPIADVAADLKTSVEVLKEWAKDRGFPAYPVTRESWFVVVDDLPQWLRKHGNPIARRQMAGKAPTQKRNG